MHLWIPGCIKASLEMRPVGSLAKAEASSSIGLLVIKSAAVPQSSAMSC